MKVGVIGALGFIGKNIVSALRKDFEVIEITKSNYRGHIGERFDVLINANGNSTKFLANRYPKRDFEASVITVMDSFKHFKYDKYIYISTIDAEKNNDMYGFNRYLAEQMVERYCDNWVIVRCCAVIGKGAVKGVVNDILSGNEVYLTKDSKLQLITVTEVANKLVECLYGKRNELLRFYSDTSIYVKAIAGILKKELFISKNAKRVIYNYKSESNEFKTSIQYLKDIL